MPSSHKAPTVSKARPASRQPSRATPVASSRSPEGPSADGGSPSALTCPLAFALMPTMPMRTIADPAQRARADVATQPIHQAASRTRRGSKRRRLPNDARTGHRGASRRTNTALSLPQHWPRRARPPRATIRPARDYHEHLSQPMLGFDCVLADSGESGHALVAIGLTPGRLDSSSRCRSLLHLCPQLPQRSALFLPTGNRRRDLFRTRPALLRIVFEKRCMAQCSVGSGALREGTETPGRFSGAECHARPVPGMGARGDSDPETHAPNKAMSGQTVVPSIAWVHRGAHFDANIHRRCPS